MGGGVLPHGGGHGPDQTSGKTSKGEGAWIPLMEYAMRRGVSLSTLRRHIKANKIQYRVEQGRYLLWDEDGVDLPAVVSPQQPAVPTASTVIAHGTPIGTLADRTAKTAGDAKLARLESELKKAHEEIAELKMLVALYEEKISRDRFES